MAGVQEIQQLIDYIRRLEQQAASAQPTVRELREAIAQLLSAGPGVRMPSGAMLENIDKTSAAVKALGDKWERVDKTVRAVTMSVGQIKYQVQRTGIGLGAVEPFMSQAKLRGGGVRTELIGTSAQMLEFAQSTARMTDAGLRLDTTLERMARQFGGVGVSLEGVSSQLNLTTGELSIQATAVTQAGEKWKVFSKVVERSSRAGTTLAPTPGAGMLRETLGAEKFKEFDQMIHKMGFSMKDLASATEDPVAGFRRFVFRIKEGNDAVKQAVFTFDNLGRILKDTSTRFKSFDQMLARNINKVLEWAISVGVVFGTMRMLQQSFRDLTEMQAAMADLAIITGESTNAMSRYFDTLADVARETGTDINDVMKGAAVAIRVGEGATEAERLASGFEFLGDAAAYAKLANIDVAKSADLLNATLSQLGEPIGKTRELLDKWVAVSRFANISMLDLGTAFATTSGAAKSAGVDIDELNGYIAAMAVATSKSAQESANALRAGFAAIQQPSTQKALLEYGIAVTDVDGRMRDWSDVLADINMLLSTFGADTAGAEEAMSKLAYALGGQGARRQADWVAFLKEQNTAQEATIKSMEAEGELESALAIKTDTLQTSIIDLKNAFMELVEALGTEGGFLDLLTNSVTMLTTVVGGIESLTEVLGPATVAVAAFFVAWAVGSKMALPEKIAKGGMAAGLGKAMRPMFTPGPAAGKTGALYGAAAGVATGLATGDWTQAAGVGIGTAIGFSLAGPAGGMAGAAIGQAIAGSIETSIPLWRQQLGLEEAPVAATMGREEILEELRTRTFGGALAGIREYIAKAQFPELTGEDLLIAQAKAVAEQPSGQAGRWGWEERPGAERMLELIKALDELTTAVEAVEAIGGEAPSGAYQQAMTSYRAQLMPQLQEQLRERRKELPIEFARNQVGSAREFAATMERTRTIGDQLIPVFYALTEASEALGMPIKDTKQEFVNLGMEMVAWSDESITFIMGQAAALIELQNQGKATTEVFQEFFSVLQGQRTIEIGRAFGPFPGIKDFGDVTAEEFQTVIANAREAQELAMSQLGIPDEVINSIDKWAYHLKGAGDEAYGWMEGLSQQFVDSAIQDLEELKGAQEDTFNVRRLKDVDPSKMGEIAAANRYWIEYLSRMKGMTAQQYMDVEGEQFNLILGEGNVLQQIYSTNEAMLFALQDIKELEEKQLEGMWNIPSGATFWVPLTSLFYQQDEGGGFPELPELLPPTERTAENTAEISADTTNIAESLQWSKEGQERYYKSMLELMATEAREEREPGAKVVDLTEEEIEMEKRWAGIDVAVPIGEEEPYRLAQLAERTLDEIETAQRDLWLEREKAAYPTEPTEEQPTWLENLWKLITGPPVPIEFMEPGGFMEIPPREEPPTLKGVPEEERENWLEKIWSLLKLSVPEEGTFRGRPVAGEDVGARLPTPYEIVGDEFMQLWRTWQKKLFGKDFEPDVGDIEGFPTTQERPTGVQPPIPWEVPIVVDPTVDVNVEVETSGAFTINNTVTLDGRIIARYVQRIIAEALENVIRSHTDTNTSVR